MSLFIHSPWRQREGGFGRGDSPAPAFQTPPGAELVAGASPPSLPLEPEPFPSLLGDREGTLGRQMTPPVVLQISCHIFFHFYRRILTHLAGLTIPCQAFPGASACPEAGASVGRWRQKGLSVHQQRGLAGETQTSQPNPHILPRIPARLHRQEGRRWPWVMGSH